MYDDENYDDGFDEAALAAHINMDLWKKGRGNMNS